MPPQSSGLWRGLRHNVNLLGPGFIETVGFDLQCHKIEPEPRFQHRMGFLEYDPAVDVFANAQMRGKYVPSTRQCPGVGMMNVPGA